MGAGQRRDEGTHPSISTRYDVFISYRHDPDLELARAIENALTAEGLTVFRDEEEIRNRDDILNRIDTALSQSKLLLAHYSPTYQASPWCQWEFSAAYLAGLEIDNPHNRVVVINTARNQQDDHIVPEQLRSKLIPRISSPQDQDAIELLAEQCHDACLKLGSYLGDHGRLRRPRWYGKRRIPTNHFVGRAKNLWDIHGLIEGDPTASIVGSSRGPAHVSGMGGIGKSMLAIEYAFRFSPAFPGGIFWLEAGGGEFDKAQLASMLRDQLSSILHTFRPREVIDPEWTTSDIKNRINQHIDQPALWVVDDIPVDAPEQEFDSILDWHGPEPHTRTLFTTRSDEYDLGQQHKLDVLDPAEALVLLTRLRKPSTEGERQSAENIVETLGRHPLAVDVAAAWLKTCIKDNLFDSLSAWLTDSTDQDEALTTVARELKTRQCVVKLLLDSLDGLVGHALDVLRIAYWVSPELVHGSFVTEVLGKVDTEDANTVERSFQSAVNALASRSLLKVQAENNATFVEVHALVARSVAIRDREEGPARLHELRDTMAQVLSDKLKVVSDYREHKRLQKELTYGRKLARHLDSEATCEVAARVGYADYVAGQYATARSLEERVLDAQRRILCSEHPDTLTSMNNLAATLSAMGELQEAREVHQQTLNIRRRVLGSEHPDTLTSMNNLAETLRAMGKLQEAREVHQQTLDIFSRVQGAEHPSTLKSMNNLAMTLRAMGELQEARELHQQTLDISRRVLGSEHPDTLTSMNNLAATLRAMGELQEARELQQQTLDIFSRVQGAEHPTTLTFMNNLALTFRAMGELHEALRLFQQVFAGLRRVLGDSHPHTQFVMNCLAETRKRISESARLSDQPDDGP